MTIDELLEQIGMRPEDETQLLVLMVVVILALLLLHWALKKSPSAPDGEIKANVHAATQKELEQAIKDELSKESATLLGGDMKVNQQEITYGEPTYKNGHWHQSATMKWKR